MKNDHKVGVIILVFFLVIVLVIYSQNAGENGGAFGNLFSGSGGGGIFSSGNTVTTETPSGGTVTKEVPNIEGPGRSTVFPDDDRGTVNIYYDESVEIKPEDRTWFPNDIGSSVDSPYGNPFNHLFPVDSDGNPIKPPGDMISHATTSAFGTLPPHGAFQDNYQYTDRPNMPSPSTKKPVNTTSAYGTLPAHDTLYKDYKYTDRPNMPSPSTKKPVNTTSAYGTLPSHSAQDWMYTDRPVI